MVAAGGGPGLFQGWGMQPNPEYQLRRSATEVSGCPTAPGPPCQEPPQTRLGLATAFRRLGICEGDTLLVHSSLRSLGYVVGGAAAVVHALLDTVGAAGTVVVPTFTAGNSDPSRWARTMRSAAPPEWWTAIREDLPPFDPALTASQNMGVVAEAVRTWPGSIRSSHPQTSFAAVGRHARFLMSGHPQDCHLGPRSPLGRLAESDGKVLLLGVPFGVCTAFHLAEYQQPDPPLRDYECVVAEAGGRRWYRYRDVLLDDSDFQRLGEAMDASPVRSQIRRIRIGTGVSRLIPLPVCVSFAREWIATHREQAQPAPAPATTRPITTVPHEEHPRRR